MTSENGEGFTGKLPPAAMIQRGGTEIANNTFKVYNYLDVSADFFYLCGVAHEGGSHEVHVQTNAVPGVRHRRHHHRR